MSATKSITNLLISSCKQNPGNSTNAFIGLTFLYQILQNYILTRAASDPLKQAFLDDNFRIIGKFRLDIFASIIDANWEVMEKSDVLVNETKVGCFFCGPVHKMVGLRVHRRI